MLLGIVLSIIAGMAMSVQGVMNTRLGEGIGNMEANAFVQGTAFALAGALGLVITLTVMLGIKSLGTTVAISIILMSQLLVAALIDAFGLMGSEKIAFGWNKFVGLAVMCGGMLLFKLR